MSFRFETREVTAPETAQIRERLEGGRGGCLFGPLGSGTSHAARAALRGLPGAIELSLQDGPLLGLRVMVDVARQVGPQGRNVLDALRAGGLEAAVPVAEVAINGHALLVDDAHALAVGPPNPDDPAGALWSEEREALRAWLTRRAEETPTLLVGRRKVKGASTSWRHESPEKEWILSLKETPNGYRDWQNVARLARGNPGALQVAAAVVPLVGAEEFDELLAQANDENADEGVFLRRLGATFCACAPAAWQHLLGLIAAVRSVPKAALLRRGATQAPFERQTLDTLVRLHLLEERGDLLTVLPALVEAGGVGPVTEQQRSEALPGVAHALLAPINALDSLAPADADAVLRAHAIFVDLGDDLNAERTAALHVHGLVDLARRTSIAADYPKAWRQYDAIWRMLQSRAFCVTSPTGRHLESYVRHYRAWNGAKAGTLDDRTCAEEYSLSIESWRDNALWHQRYISSLVRLGDLTTANRAVDAAYRDDLVPPHPRRDEFLRVRPAQTAMRSRAQAFALRLLDPLMNRWNELDPPADEDVGAVVEAWAEGCKLQEIAYTPSGADRLGAEPNEAFGRVAFLRPTTVTLGQSVQAWVARLPELAAEGRAHTPWVALGHLAANVAEEAHRLIATPSSELGQPDLRRKGALLSLVDALESDIGLEHDSERWLVGQIRDGALVPTMRELGPVELPPELAPQSEEGLYFARVPVHRDGSPSGPVSQLKPAGRGRSHGDLLDLLMRMAEDESG